MKTKTNTKTIIAAHLNQDSLATINENKVILSERAIESQKNFFTLKEAFEKAGLIKDVHYKISPITVYNGKDKMGRTQYKEMSTDTLMQITTATKEYKLYSCGVNDKFAKLYSEKVLHNTTFFVEYDAIVFNAKIEIILPRVDEYRVEKPCYFYPNVNFDFVIDKKFNANTWTSTYTNKIVCDDINDSRRKVTLKRFAANILAKHDRAERRLEWALERYNQSKKDSQVAEAFTKNVLPKIQEEFKNEFTVEYSNKQCCFLAGTYRQPVVRFNISATHLVSLYDVLNNSSDKAARVTPEQLNRMFAFLKS